MNDAASKIAADVLLPFVRLFIVTFDVVDRGNTVEPADGEDHVIDHLYREVTAWIIHIWYRAPNICGRIVLFSATHSRYAVETTCGKSISIEMFATGGSIYENKVACKILLQDLKV